jgi:hypothetical protein
MNQIPVIRKGAIKDYWANGIVGGFLLGLIFFLISLMDHSVSGALVNGLAVWIGIIVLFIGVGFPSEEYYKRKKRIKELSSPKYAFLDENGFSLHPDLYFEGTYKEFFFRILPMTKWIEKKKGRDKEIHYVIIESFYSFNDDSQNPKKEENMSGDYFVGRVQFMNQCASLLPKDYENPDFQMNLDGLVSIFHRSNLQPLSKEEWENTHGKSLDEEREKAEKAKTKQILKIGKLDIKYRKPEQNL